MRSPLLLALLTLPAPIASAATGDWDIQPLLLTGQAASDGSLLTALDQVSIDEALGWRIKAFTDNPDPSKVGVLEGPAGAVMQRGQALLEPAGTTLDFIQWIARDGAGADVLAANAGNTPGGSSDDDLLLYDEHVVYREGQKLTAPGFPSGSVWTDIGVPAAAGKGRLCVSGSYLGPGMLGAGTALVQVDVDPSGNILKERLLARQGDSWQATGELIEFSSNTMYMFDVNTHGTAIYRVNTDASFLADDYLMLEDKQLAQEGQPSPLPGRTWRDLSTARACLSDTGSYAFSGRLSGDIATEYVLVVDGEVAYQLGDPVPGQPGAVLRHFGFNNSYSPLHLDDQGRLFWYGAWEVPGTGLDLGLFVDDELIVKDGDSLGAGLVVQQLVPGGESTTVSPDGRFVVFKARLTDGREGVFLASPEGATTNRFGCSGNLGVMKFVAGGPALGSSVQLSLSSPQDPYALAFLGVSGALLLDSSGCGLALPGIGELLIGVQPFPLLLPAGKFTGTGALTTGGVLPSDLSFVGLSLHLQGLFVSATQPLEPVRLTNAISIDIGL